MGDELPRTRSTTARAINYLKDIVKCFLLCLEIYHFILGDELPRTRSTTARAINCLKDIVFNTRLDHS